MRTFPRRTTGRAGLVRRLGTATLAGPLLLVAASAQGPVGPVDVLRPGPNPAFWAMKTNGGSVRDEGGSLVLYPSEDGRSYPFLVSRAGCLRGDWTLTLRFRFLRIGDRGQGVALRNLRTGRELLRVHADAVQRGIQLWAGDASQGAGGAWNGAPSVALGGDPLAEHAYSVSRSGGLYTLLYDGKELARCRAEPGEYALRIGSDGATYPGTWSTISLSSLTVRYAGEPPHFSP